MINIWDSILEPQTAANGLRVGGAQRGVSISEGGIGLVSARFLGICIFMLVNVFERVLHFRCVSNRKKTGVVCLGGGEGPAGIRDTT